MFATGVAPDGICLDAGVAISVSTGFSIARVANLDRLANGPRAGEILTLPVEVPGVGRP